jgi:acyl carrier protein
VLALGARTAGGAVDADTPLLEAGLDSLGAVELRNQLQQVLDTYGR